MKMLTVTDVARNFRLVVGRVESGQEEIVLTRGRKPVARLVPEPALMNALAVFGDLYRTMDDDAAAGLKGEIFKARRRRTGRLSELRDPWAS
ncbi:MAG: type II toxin-antitoxin system Phd/YefM family antitoxin [Verrucomicrobiae bacterium]